METQFDYARLKDLIETTKYFDSNDNEYKTYNKKTFAKAIGISYYSLYKKLKNIVPFNQAEIMKMVKVLKLEVKPPKVPMNQLIKFSPTN